MHKILFKRFRTDKNLNIMKSIHEVKSVHETHVGERVENVYIILGTVWSIFYGCSKIDEFFYPLGPKAKIGEIHSFV